MPDLSYLDKQKAKKKVEFDDKERIQESRKAYHEKALKKYPRIAIDKKFNEAVTKGEMQRAVKAWLIGMKAKGTTVIPLVDKEWYRE